MRIFLPLMTLEMMLMLSSKTYELHEALMCRYMLSLSQRVSFFCWSWVFVFATIELLLQYLDRLD
jgi:hypothetical protein